MQSFGEILRKILEALASFFKSRSPAKTQTSKPVPKPENPLPPVVDVPPPVVPQKPKWHSPIHADKFRVTQKFFTPDSKNYPKTGHHPGTDYGTQGADNIPLFYCADGEVIESGNNHKYFGNYFFYYVPEVDRTFVYFHLRDTAPVKGTYAVGEECGIAGNTGLSFGAHLHLECMKGRQTSADRSRLYSSPDALTVAAEDPDPFIRMRL